VIGRNKQEVEKREYVSEEEEEKILVPTNYMLPFFNQSTNSLIPHIATMIITPSSLFQPEQFTGNLR